MSAITIACAVINIVTNYFGIAYFGYIAAGYTTLLCAAIQMISYYFVVKRYEKKLKEIVDLRAFFAIMVVYVGFMIYSMIFTYNFWARFGLLVVVFGVVIIFHKKIIELFKNMTRKENPAESNA